MGFRAFAAAAVTAALAFATPAAAVTLTFNVQVTEATGDAAFTPFTFQESWTFTPAYSESGGPMGPGMSYNVVQRITGAATVTDSPVTSEILDPAAFPFGLFGEARFASRLGYDGDGNLVHSSAGAEFGLIGQTFADGVTDRYYRTLSLQSAGPYLAASVDLTGLIAFLQAEGPIRWSEGMQSYHLDDNWMPVFDFDRSYRGTATLVVDSAAPEPGAWLLMIGGFGIAGAALRSRRRDLRQAA